MADHDYKVRAVRAFDDWRQTIEVLAQDSAATEAVLYSKDRSADELSRWRLEYELRREIDCWEAIAREIERLVSDRNELLTAQIRSRSE